MHTRPSCTAGHPQEVALSNPTEPCERMMEEEVRESDGDMRERGEKEFLVYGFGFKLLSSIMQQEKAKHIDITKFKSVFHSKCFAMWKLAGREAHHFWKIASSFLF